MDEGRADQLALAAHFLAVQRPADALRALERAGPEEDPVRFHLLRTEAFLLSDRLLEARRAVEAGLEEEPESVALLVLLAHCQERAEELAAAERTLLTALRQAPEEPGLLCRYGRLMARAGRLEKARRLLAEARRVDPGAPEAARLEMLVDYLAGKDRMVEVRSRKLLAEDPEDVHGVLMLGVSLLERGAAGRARRIVTSAAASAPESFGELAIETRLWAHPLMVPLRPVRRFGPVASWFGAIAIILGLSLLGRGELSLLFALSYLVFCVYSWVVPPLLRRWLRRRLA